MKTFQGAEVGTNRGPVAHHYIVYRFLRVALRCCLLASAFIVAGVLPAQTLTTLHTFNGITDGDEPESPLVFLDGEIYGATRYGGIAGKGTVFKMAPDGTGFSTLYHFTDSDVDGNAAGPYGPLVVSGDSLYGTASGIPSGTVFKIKTDGSSQSVLHVFSGVLDGDEPFGGLILSSNTLYGTTSTGIIFKVNTDGSGFTVLYCVGCDPAVGPPGSTIYGGLVLASNYLFGTAFSGGLDDDGIVFKLSTDGTDFAVLHSFQGNDGAAPWSSLLLYSNRLYGTTTRGGGSNSVGVVFAVSPDGTGYTNLHSFVGLEGGWPQGGMIASGSTLYGTTMQGGGVGGAGTIFSINTDGSGFRTLYTFTGGADGGAPASTLTLVSNALYGTTTTGANQNNGTIFRLSLPGPLPAAFTRSANNLVVSWPTNSSGFVLQTSTDLKAWTTVSTTPQIINGSYAVTNSISEQLRFFRLSR